MLRTARSPIFNQSHDFSCFLTDGSGRLVSQADGIPIHTGGGGLIVEAVLRGLRRHRAGGRVHLERPLRGRRQPPARLGREPSGLRRRGDLRLRLQPRAPIGHRRRRRRHLQPRGDRDLPRRHPAAAAAADRARHAAAATCGSCCCSTAAAPTCSTATSRPCSARPRSAPSRCSRWPRTSAPTDRLRYLDGILDYADRRMRAAVAELPDGVYIGAEMTDNDCFTECEIWIRVTITKSGDSGCSSTTPARTRR